jgi:hypothetical protein
VPAPRVSRFRHFRVLHSLRLIASGTATFAILMLTQRTAAAQTVGGLALDRFEPAGAGSAWMTLESLDFEGHLRPTFAVVGDWAWKPLVFYDPSGHELGALVRQQAMFGADASVTLWNRARLDVLLPVPIVDGGGDVQIGGRSYSAPSGGGVGDVRLGADVRVLGAARGRWRVAAGAQLFLPTGGPRQFTGDGAVRFWPRLMVAGDRGRLTWAARAGVHVRPSDKCGCDLAPGSELTLGAAAGWWMSPRLLLGAELYGSRAFSSGGAVARAAPPVEVLLAGHFTPIPHWRASLGVAPGLTNGPGSPTVRVVLGVEYDMTAKSSPEPTTPPPSGATP